MALAKLRVDVKPLGPPYEENVRARLLMVRVNGSEYQVGTLTIHRAVWLSLWRPLFWLGQAKGLLTIEMDEPTTSGND